MSKPRYPDIVNLSLPSADTEVEYVIPDGTKQVTFKLRSQIAELKFCYTSGESGTTFLTLPAGSSKTLDGVKLRGQSLFFQSPSASQVVEIEVVT